MWRQIVVLLFWEPMAINICSFICGLGSFICGLLRKTRVSFCASRLQEAGSKGSQIFLRHPLAQGFPRGCELVGRCGRCLIFLYLPPSTGCLWLTQHRNLRCFLPHHPLLTLKTRSSKRNHKAFIIRQPPRSLTPGPLHMLFPAPGTLPLTCLLTLSSSSVGLSSEEISFKKPSLILTAN